MELRKLTVVGSGTPREIRFSPGLSVREILEGAGFLIRAGCRGDGACGLCVVQIEEGEVGPTTKNECLSLPPEQLAQNFRLACQLKPESDLAIRIINTASKLRWRDLAPDFLPCTPSHLSSLADGTSAEAAYGLAVDLGTTQISFSLWDLKCGHRLLSRVGPNPQSPYGIDIVTRLIAASDSPENARRLARLPLEALAEDLQQMASHSNLPEADTSLPSRRRSSGRLSLETPLCCLY